MLLVEEVTREMWGWRWLTNLGQDVRHALAALLAAVAVAGSWIPARRAAALDPLAALRHD